MNLFKLFKGKESKVEDDGVLKPIVNVFDVNGFWYESDTVRANMFVGFNQPHFHPDESGVFFIITPTPELHIRDEVKPGNAGEVVGFDINEIHGFLRGGKCLALHGYIPYEKSDGYEILKAEYVKHPSIPGYSVVIDYSVNGIPQDTRVYGPESMITLGGALRALDYEMRKSFGEDVNGINLGV